MTAMKKYLLVVVAPVTLSCYSLIHTPVSNASVDLSHVRAGGEVLIQLKDGSRNRDGSMGEDV
jgi:hypothetical protein